MLAPKVYGGIDLNGNEFTKVKGFKDKLSLSDLEELLHEKSIKFHNEKWYRDKATGRIIIKDLLYTLRSIDNKRYVIYDYGYLVRIILLKSNYPLNLGGVVCLLIYWISLILLKYYEYNNKNPIINENNPVASAKAKPKIA